MISVWWFAKAETRIFSSNPFFFIALCFLKFQLETFIFCRVLLLATSRSQKSRFSLRKILKYRPKSQYKKKAEQKV